MIALFIAVFVAGLSLGVGGMEWWTDAQHARHEAALVKAQATVDALSIKAETDAARKITEMAGAFAAGEANAKIVTKTVYVKGQAYVANTPVFSNPVCVVPPDGVQLLNGARAGTQLAPAASGSDVAVSGAGAATGRTTLDPIFTNAAGHGAVGGVPSPPSAASGSGEVPATGSGRVRPKPAPTK